MNTSVNSRFISALRQNSTDAVNATGRVIDTGKGFANDAFDKTESKLNSLRGKVDPVVNVISDKAQKLARQSADMAANAKDRVQQSLIRASDRTTQYVAEQPLRSVLIAVAVGAGVALLIAATSHRNKDRY